MYCILDDVKKQLPEAVIMSLTDDEIIGEIDETNFEKAIADADAEIDGYCRPDCRCISGESNSAGSRKY